jgi:hypothetical protein
MLLFSIVLLTSLIALGHIIDFCIGSSGQRRIKDRVTEFYIHVAESDWSPLYRQPASVAGRYLDCYFGRPSFSMKFIKRVLAYSLICSVVVLAMYRVFRALGGPNYGHLRMLSAAFSQG